MRNVHSDGMPVSYQVDLGNGRDKIYKSLDEQEVGRDGLLVVTKGINKCLHIFNS